MESKSSQLRSLPSVDEVLKRPAIEGLLETSPRWAVTQAVRNVIDERRRSILADDGSSPEAGEVEDSEIDRALSCLLRPALRRVINATGVVVHTNLGRSPLAPSALSRIETVAFGYSNLEYDVDRGERGSRHDHLRRLAASLCGAEDAVVTNNNAGALLLTLSALAAGKEVVISRGELVEIGGGFRIPEVIVQGGATLKEVGTTNRTRLADYERVLSDETGALLKVHQSNFAVVGFTEEVDVRELSALARAASVPLVVDLGSGAMMGRYGPGLPGEPTVKELLDHGADLVCFSGDKLLGGPQAGIVLGRAELVSRVRKHPLMRALRPGKLNLAALEATLELWRDGRSEEIPVVRMLGRDPAAAKARARRFATRLRRRVSAFDIDVVAVEGRAGGGSMPLGAAPGWGIALRMDTHGASAIEEALRAGSPPVICRIIDDKAVLDLRTVDAGDEGSLLSRLVEVEDHLGVGKGSAV